MERGRFTLSSLDFLGSIWYSERLTYSSGMKAQDTLDCCGHLCPAPILMTEEKIGDLRSGQILEVIFTDPGARPDLETWCRATGHRALLFNGPSKDGKCFAYIQRK